MVRADYSKTSSLSIPTESASSGLESLQYAFRLSCSGRCSSAAEQGSHKPRVGGSIPPTATNFTDASRGSGRRYQRRIACHFSLSIRILVDVEDIVRYVARNREAKGFEPRVLEEFHRLNMMARDEPDRYALLRLFYAAILRKPTGLEAEVPYDAVVANVRARYPGEVDGLVERWLAIGERLAA